ncbi:MarR family winged helix-turn-helix transcriptional regulator [Azorhizobium oxalatiphilum]|uniref:MarR family winged helix-turn-helix transcriptional regulator n=1 Tax=Azorhizobium oxalatiphilum TaxID=980631 RepID=UPI001FCEA929|nr:MarR family winged helix-turn-helix transcriptional regulator [Azorhizobium oxalatiphilum]
MLRADDWSRAKAVQLNPTQYAILVHLQGRPSGLGIKDIAFQLGVSQPTTTDSVAALERKGLVVRHTDLADRRAVHVRLTADAETALQAARSVPGHAHEAVAALDRAGQEKLLLLLIAMIRQLQETGAIPIQRMCASCRHFRPFVHADAARPHHCTFVDASFGQQDLRIECREHEAAAPASRAATWDAFAKGIQTLQA